MSEMKLIPNETVDSKKMEDDGNGVVDSENKKEDSSDPWDNSDKVLGNIVKEQVYSEKFMRPKWDAWVTRLKLYNNQKKGKYSTGDPLVFTIMQTVLASLYSDQLMVEWEGRNEGASDQAENLTNLALFDGEEMENDQLDYEWDWDTCFTGRGLKLLQEFDRDTMTPVAEIIDPFTWYRDPRAKSVNGDKRGRGAMRFGGREIVVTKRELEKKGVYKNIDELKCDSLTDTPIQISLQQRQFAQGFNTIKEELAGDNESYIIWEWWTWWKGEKYFFTVGNKGTVLLRAEKVRTRRWPIVDRALYPTAHDWDGVSIPDLVEDKQRARATLQNLGLKGVRANLYPNYLYNRQLIKNKASIAKFEFNKFTGVDGNPTNAIAPIPRQQVQAEVGWILGLLNEAAQQATATPDIKQGGVSGKVKSATEIAQASQGVDTRFSLAAKIWGWSEARCWKLWYELYDIYMSKAIDEKVIRISGALGPSWRRFSKSDIITESAPDVKIQSRAVADAKRMNKMNMIMAFMNQGIALDPSFNKRFALKQLGKAMGLSTDEINRYLPKTFDEWEAEQENIQIDKGELPKITLKQNHIVHIEMHTKAKDSNAKTVHIAMHYAALFAMRQNPALMPPPLPPGMGPQTVNGQGGPVNQDGQSMSPRSIAQDPLQLQASNTVQQAQ